MTQGCICSYTDTLKDVTKHNPYPYLCILSMYSVLLMQFKCYLSDVVIRNEVGGIEAVWFIMD